MLYMGGSVASSKVHLRVLERLQKEFGLSETEAKAAKSILYDLVKGESMTGLEKANKMESFLTEDQLKKLVKPTKLKERIKMLEEYYANKDATKKKSKNASSRRRTQSAGRKRRSKKASSKTKKSASKKRTSSKKKRRNSSKK